MKQKYAEQENKNCCDQQKLPSREEGSREEGSRREVRRGSREEGSRRSQRWMEEGRSSGRSRTRVEVEPVRSSRDKAANISSLRSHAGQNNCIIP